MKFKTILISISVVCLLSGCYLFQPTVDTGSITGNAYFTNDTDHSNVLISVEPVLDPASVYRAQATRRATIQEIAASTRTASDGSYTISNLESGRYTIYASCADSREKAVSTNIVVETGGLTTVDDLFLTATGSVEGRVVLDGTETGNIGFLVFIAGTSFMAMTDDSGTFTISDVPVGDGYYIVVQKGGFLSAGYTVNVTAGDTVTIEDIVLSGATDESWTTGFGVPTATIADEGALYLDLDTGDVYQMLSGVWQFQMTLKGADGIEPIATPAGEVSNLATTPSYPDTDIVVSWDDPDDVDLDHVEITWDGGFGLNILKGIEAYTFSDLVAGSGLSVVVKTIDAQGYISAGASVTVLLGDPKIAVGLFHTLILKSDSALWACGENALGQFGDGTLVDRHTPVQVMTHVADIATGDTHSLIMKTDGTLWACGYNDIGQLGDGSTEQRSSPVQVMAAVTRIAAGSRHNMILKTDSTLWAFGSNNYGQLGDGTTTDRHTPVQIATDVAGIAAGGLHSLVLKTDETLWACGENFSGQLGDGTFTQRYTLVQVMTDVSDIAAGLFHSMILKTDHTLWACGFDESGQLGDGDTTSGPDPVQVMTDVADIVAGDYHTLILKTDGTLWVCGDNEHGQLGDGTTTDRHLAVQVMTDVAEIAAGCYHSLVLKTDGTLWACGNNEFGQLGDGTTTDRSTPVLVTDIM